MHLHPAAGAPSRGKKGARIHVLHVSTGEEIEFLGQHKDMASVEVTPQHLTLSGRTTTSGSAQNSQMNPPIRGTPSQQRCGAAIDNGVVDVLGSDHAPHTCEEKASPIRPAHPA